MVSLDASFRHSPCAAVAAHHAAVDDDGDADDDPLNPEPIASPKPWTRQTRTRRIQVKTPNFLLQLQRKSGS